MGRQAAKRASVAGVSVSMAPGGVEEGGERPVSAVRQFFVAHMKTIVTLFMIFGTIAVIVVIVMGESI